MLTRREVSRIWRTWSSLAPARDALARLWVTDGGRNLDLVLWAGLPEGTGLVLGCLIALVALEVSRRQKIGAARLVFASGVGFAVAVGYGLTYALSAVVFEPVSVTSATFTGPSAKTLMFFLERDAVLGFDVGLVPGVFLGALLAAALAGELKLQGFEGSTPMRRAMIGAALMGFGGMLAGGCAIGAGVTGGAIFAGTAWVALTAMWLGGIATHLVLMRGQQAAPA